MLRMKKYSIIVLIMLSLTILPFWVGNASDNTQAEDSTIVKTEKLNVSLFESRLRHNSELINLSKSYKVKNELKDSILSAREEQINNYRNLLGYLESRNRYVIDNGKFIGAYQFGPSALKNVGLGHITREDFLKDPTIFPDSLQDWAVIEFAAKNQKMMNRKLNLNHYVGKKIRGVKITKGGILAAAHLIGWSDCSIYLSSWGKFNPADGNGTSATDYMRKFQDHDIWAFDVNNDFEDDLSRLWVENKMPKYSLDKIY